MRRFIVLPLLLALTFVLAACGGTKAPATPAPGASSNSITISQAAGSVSASAAPQQTSFVPVVESAGLVMDNITTTSKDRGVVAFRGAITNTGNEEVRATRITIELLNEAGQRIARVSFSQVSLPAIKPGETVWWEGQPRQLDGEWQGMRGIVEASPLSATK